MFNFKIYFMSEQSPLSLGTEDIKKLLMRYAVPAIVAMTAASLYNMIYMNLHGDVMCELRIAGLYRTRGGGIGNCRFGRDFPFY